MASFNMFACNMSSAYCNSKATNVDTHPTEIDEQDRFDMYFSHTPSGSGYLNTIHFGQLVGHEDPWFGRFDYGAEKNLQKYGQQDAPVYDMSLISYPIAAMFGTEDKLISQVDAEWTTKQLAHTTKFVQHYYLGHESFNLAKDMSFFTQDAMAFINTEHGVCDDSTKNTTYKVAREECGWTN